MGNHNEAFNHVTDSTQHKLHPAGYTVSDLTALAAITTMQPKDLALVSSPISMYMYADTGGGVYAWTLIATEIVDPDDDPLLLAMLLGGTL